MLDENFAIFDCDMGTDDAWALLMLIKAETVLKLFKIMAITSVVGNTYVGNATENVFRMLESVNRTDIPIYKGCSEPLMYTGSREFFFGLDGFGDVLPSNPETMEYIEGGHAVNMMYELASKHPKKISFVMAGPLTNLATCIIMHDDFLDKVKDIWILGGNLYDIRNTSTEAEFNFRIDTLAARIVLEHAAKVPVYIIPSETCEQAHDGIDLAFRFDYLGSVYSPPINLLNKVEKEIFVPKSNWIAYDPMMASAFVFPEKMIVKIKKYYGTVEACGKDAGAMVLDHSGHDNVFVIEKLDADNYKNIIAWTAGVQHVQLKS